MYKQQFFREEGLLPSLRAFSERADGSSVVCRLQSEEKRRDKSCAGTGACAKSQLASGCKDLVGIRGANLWHDFRERTRGHMRGQATRHGL